MLAPNASIPVNGVMFDYCAGSVIPFFKLKHKDPEVAKDNFNDFVRNCSSWQSDNIGYFLLCFILKI
jgi:hypothetical protein